MGLISFLKRFFSRKSPDTIGAAGERKVSSVLSPRFFGKTEHFLINNLMISDENGRSHQIDHLEIRHNGIFCIETKNYSGKIFGNESQQHWTQVFLYGEKYQLPNPIKQNRAHIYHLNRTLGGKYRINSIIVMVQNNAGKVHVPYVVNLRDLKEYLDNYQDGTNYSSDQMLSIYKTLILASRPEITSSEHIKSIEDTKTLVENNICPRCGAHLRLRHGKYGVFYGCSNYPNCTFVKKQ